MLKSHHAKLPMQAPRAQRPLVPASSCRPHSRPSPALARRPLTQASASSKQQAGEASAAAGTVRAKPEQYNSPAVRELLSDITRSYEKFTKQKLVPDVPPEHLGHTLFTAPFALLAHNMFQPGVTDPAFTYANKAALQLWETQWEGLVGQLSKKSAIADQATQADRNKLLEKAATTGVVTNYEGWRVSANGSKFKILKVTLFNVENTEGQKVGQAAYFTQYALEDGTLVTITKPRASQAEVDAAELAVAKQADVVWNLRSEQRLGAEDPQVLAAVAELRAVRAAHEELLASLAQ